MIQTTYRTWCYGVWICFSGFFEAKIEKQKSSDSFSSFWITLCCVCVSSYLINANPKQHQTIWSNENKLEETVSIWLNNIPLKCNAIWNRFNLEFFVIFHWNFCLNSFHKCTYTCLKLRYFEWDCIVSDITKWRHFMLNLILYVLSRTLIKYVFRTNVSKPILRWSFPVENFRNS